MDRGFWDLIEQTLEFRYYRGGNYHTVLSDDYREHPHMVLGQVVGNGLRSHVVGHGRYRVADGHGYCTPAGWQRRTRNDGGRPAMFHWAHVDFLAAGGIDLARLVTFPLVLSASAGRRIGAINRRLLEIDHREQRELADIVERQRLGMEVLQLLLSESPDGGHLDAARLRQARRIQPVLEHMREHLADPLSMRRLAAHFDLSLLRFHELFVAFTGVSPGRYQLRLRLQRAQARLIAGDEPIKDIAAACGFDDNHYFSRIFKKRVGMTPGQYRAAGERMV